PQQRWRQHPPAAAVPVMAARAVLEASAVSRDVVLFRHDRSRFFRLLGVFCVAQGAFWVYLAHWAFTALRPTPAPGSGPDDPLRPRDNKWRFGFTAVVVGEGGGGRDRDTVASAVTIVTSRVPGLAGGRTVTIPLGDVSGRAHRAQVDNGRPHKVQRSPLHFLLDKGGHSATRGSFSTGTCPRSEGTQSGFPNGTQLESDVPRTQASVSPKSKGH
uniref:Transmembrane protein 223 n=1 Tax=Malurus cyaneus samueli TaxID=2593467 RepID=A0A8C5TGK6_9PASS